MAPRRMWNANIHYHSVLLSALPRGAELVLDVGCGDGLLAAELVQTGAGRVIAIDSDAEVLERAKARYSKMPIQWVHGDVVDFQDSAAGSFDAVFSVAALHHLNAAQALARFAQWVRPGGAVGVIGLAANDWWDVPYAALALGARHVASLHRGYWEHTAPMRWPPPTTYRQIKRIARATLPGVRYRRHLYGRYSLLWTKPLDQPRA